MLGNFLLSSKFDEYNEKVRVAQMVRRMFITQFSEAMEQNEIDLVMSPTTIGEEPTRYEEVVN